MDQLFITKQVLQYKGFNYNFYYNLLNKNIIFLFNTNSLRLLKKKNFFLIKNLYIYIFTKEVQFFKISRDCFFQKLFWRRHEIMDKYYKIYYFKKDNMKPNVYIKTTSFLKNALFKNTTTF